MYSLSFLCLDESRNFAPSRDTSIPHDRRPIKIVAVIETDVHAPGQCVDSRFGVRGLQPTTDLSSKVVSNDERSPLNKQP